MSEEITEVIDKKEKIASILIVIISIGISTFIGGITNYFLIVSLLSLLFLIFRYNILIKLILTNKDKISIIPKLSLEKKRGLQNLIVIMSLTFFPFLLIYILPPILWIVSTLAIVSSWPLSTIFASILVYITEKRNNVRIYKFIVFDERLNEVNIKEYGYIVQRKSTKAT